MAYLLLGCDSRYRGSLCFSEKGTFLPLAGDNEAIRRTILPERGGLRQAEKTPY